jgi:hypothetical protein
MRNPPPELQASYFFSVLLRDDMVLARAAVGRACRGMGKSGTQDILSATLLRAWETRDDFDPSIGEGLVEGRLAEWLKGIAGDARRAYRRGELRGSSSAVLETMASSSNTASEVSAFDLARYAEGRFVSDKKKTLVRALLAGGSDREIAATARTNRAVVCKVRRMLRQAIDPTGPEYPVVLGMRTAPADTNFEFSYQSKIDRDLERDNNLTQPPQLHGRGRDCCESGCVQCKWFYAFKAPGRRVEVSSVEVGAAVKAVFDRKVLISAAIRGEVEVARDIEPLNAANAA